MLRETCSLTGELIQPRCFGNWMSVATEVSIAEVVGQDKDNIGLLCGIAERNASRQHGSGQSTEDSVSHCRSNLNGCLGNPGPEAKDTFIDSHDIGADGECGSILVVLA